MRLIAICSAALLGIALGAVARPSLTVVAAGVLGMALAACRWRAAALVGLALSLGVLRVWLPPIRAPIAPPEALAALRASAQAGIAAWLPEPQASLAAGVLLGGSGHLDAGFRDELRQAGLSHLLAIDGFKEVVVAGAVTWLVGRLCGRKLALVASLAAIGSYTLLTGAHPSAVRAALMVGLANGAALSGRLPDSLTSLVLATLGMALVEPHVLLDLSLQLSLSATLGIMLLWPHFRRSRLVAVLPRWVGEPAGLTLAVSVATLPVSLTTFHLISLISPVAHVLAMPLLPLVLASTLLLAVSAWYAPIAGVVAWLAWLPTTLLMRVVQLGGSLPGAAVSTGQLSTPAAIALALTLLAFGLWQLPELAELRLGCSRRLAQRRDLVVALAGVAACLSVAALVSLVRPDGQLHVEPLALSGGQAVFVRGPTGRTAVVVVGPASGFELTQEVSARLGVWEHQLDAVVILDRAARTCTNPLLARYPSSELVETGSARLDLGGDELLDVASAAGQLQVVRSAPTTSAARPGSAS